jgi:large subunit ribosomal protein L25
MSHVTPTIAVASRGRMGTRYARRLRSEGLLPAVIYGHGADTVHVSVNEKEVLGHLHSGSHVVTLQVDGGGDETCLVKELQFGYLGDNLIHLDFARVNLDEEVEISVSLNITGSPVSATKAGAVLDVVRSELQVRCKVRDIPEAIRVDLSKMEDAFTIGDMTFPEGVVPDLDASRHIAHITLVREEETGEEGDIDGDAVAPEVITESKEETESSE